MPYLCLEFFGMQQKNVVIACGGFSSERKISIQSGNTVQENLSAKKWHIYLLTLSKTEWKLTAPNGQEIPFSRGDFSWELEGQKQQPDVVFNAIHGAPGENGQLAALLELLDIPQTSCDAYSAGLTFNKRDCLSVVREKGIPTAKHLSIDQGMRLDYSAIGQQLGFPLFVKANRAGSSFGVYKVYDEAALENAIQEAFKEDSQLLLEAALEGREVSVGAYRSSEGIVILPLTEIISENDFFDYEAKYEGKAQEITPAKIPDEWTQLVNAQMKTLYDVLGLKGVVRSEFIFVDGVPHLLEINTVPGLTQASIIPQQLAAAQRNLGEFFEEQLHLALLKN